MIASLSSALSYLLDGLVAVARDLLLVEADCAANLPSRSWLERLADLAKKAQPPHCATSSKQLPAIEPLGVTPTALKLLLKAVKHHYGDDYITKTTTQVCDDVVKPLLAPIPNLSLVQLLQHASREKESGASANLVLPGLELKPANRFVSHAWRYTFAQVVESLLRYAEEQEEEMYYWFDLCCNNQHSAASLPYEWWTSVFATSVGNIGHTLLLYGPWDDPVPLKRSWCLFELHTSVKQGCQATVLLMDGQGLKEVLETGVADGITMALSTIDARSAEAWNPDDKAKIDQAVEASIGFVELDIQVQAYLRDSIAKQADELLLVDKANLGLMGGVASLYLDQGHLEQAELLYQRALEGYEATDGHDHSATLSAVNNLGNLYYTKGDYAQAKSLYTRALSTREVTLGPDHIATLASAYSLATLYSTQSNFDEAEALYCRVLAGRQAKLGPDHPATLNVTYNLANLYSTQGRVGEAESLYRCTLAGREAKLGSNHPATLDVLLNLGQVCQAKEDFDQAESLYHRALEGYQAKLGPDHPLTGCVINNLANLYQAQDKLKDAEPLYHRALAIKSRLLGPDHPDTLNSVNNLAVLYKKQGKLREAEPLYSQALTGYEASLGRFHRHTLMAAINLGNLYIASERVSEAQPLYRRALTGFQATLGPDHPNTSIAAQLCKLTKA
eukprot:m.82952 g.82952  ORF g.82952 m.82952 type:complete len:675 (-) comp14638_c0_seq12:71-2095(-)